MTPAPILDRINAITVQRLEVLPDMLPKINSPAV